MLISPITAIEHGWITHPDCITVNDWKDRNFVSSNAIDITLDRLFIPDDSSSSSFVLSEQTKKMKQFKEAIAINGFFELSHGYFDVLSDFYVTVPTGHAAYLIVRSTLNRNGLFVTNGLYDTKFNGNIGFALHNNSNTVAKIAPHTRIAQFIFVKSDNYGHYTGGYNTIPGQHWTKA